MPKSSQLPFLDVGRFPGNYPLFFFPFVLSLFRVWLFYLVCWLQFLVACTRLYTPLCPSVGWLVGRSHFTFFMISIFGPYCFSPNGLVISNMAPAHPHATSVAVYPALFFYVLTCYWFLSYFCSYFSLFLLHGLSSFND